MSRLTPFPLAPSAAPLVDDDFTAWASNGWVASGDDCIIDGWSDADQIQFFSQMLGFWCNNPAAEQSPAVRSTRLDKTYTGLPANRLVIVSVDVAFYAQSFGAVGKFMGMYVGTTKFAPNVASSETLTPNPGSIVGYGITNAAGELDVAFAMEAFTVSYDAHIIFDNLTITTPAAELADIYYDAGVLYITGNPFSITRGGITFDAQEEWEDYDFPGKASPVEGCEEIIRTRPVLRTSFMLTGEYQFTVYRPGGAWGNHATMTGGRTYTMPALRAALSTGLYLDSVVAVWPRARGDYVAVEFPRAIVRKYGMGSRDKDEGQIPVEIEARIPSGDSVTKVPYLIHTYASGTSSIG